MKLVSLAFVVAIAVSTNAYSQDDISQPVNQATKQLTSGDVSGSIATLSDAIKKTPSSPRLYAMRGLAFFHAKENEKARQDFDEAIRLDANDWLALGGRARLNVRTKDFSSAITDFNRAERLKPTLALYVGRSDAYAGTRQFDLALKDINTAIEMGKSDAQFVAEIHKAYLRRAEIYEGMGNSDLALKEYKLVESIAPSSQEAKTGINRLEARVAQPVNVCSQQAIQDIELKSGFNGEFDDASISNDLWKDYLNKDLSQMTDDDFARFEGAVRDCFAAQKQQFSSDRAGRILNSVRAVIKRAKATRDETAHSAVQQDNPVSKDKQSAIYTLTAYFQQFAIAQLCNELGNTFADDDINNLKSGITDLIARQNLSGDSDVTDAWSEISRKINANKNLLSQGDCTQAGEWFTYALPKVKTGKSSDFPFQ